MGPKKNFILSITKQVEVFSARIPDSRMVYLDPDYLSLGLLVSRYFILQGLDFIHFIN